MAPRGAPPVCAPCVAATSVRSGRCLAVGELVECQTTYYSVQRAVSKRMCDAVCSYVALPLRRACRVPIVLGRGVDAWGEALPRSRVDNVFWTELPWWLVVERTCDEYVLFAKSGGPRTVRAWLESVSSEHCTSCGRLPWLN